MKKPFENLCADYGLQVDWSLIEELVFVSSGQGFYAVFTKEEIESDMGRVEEHLVEMCVKSFF